MAIMPSWCATALMIEVVQGMISAYVSGPLLNWTRCLFEVLKAVTTGILGFQIDGVPVKEFALT